MSREVTCLPTRNEVLYRANKLSFTTSKEQSCHLSSVENLASLMLGLFGPKHLDYSILVIAR
jgi:hypothetical protein